MDRKAAMESLARQAYEKAVFNGTWLYAENGDIISKGAFGFRDAENRLPMREGSIFEMASVTKQFTATAVMLLVRKGRLTLDGEYRELFPDYPYPGVSIRHLLTHTSGMPAFDVEELVTPILKEEKRIPENGEIIRMIRRTGMAPAFAPGEAYGYSDVGYMLLAAAVEKASGVRFEDFLKKNIFEPAGMKDSGIYHTRRDGWPSDRFTRNLIPENGRYVPSDLSERTAGYVVGSDGMNGCDYLYTTIFDMLAWDRALREEKVLTQEEQAVMYTPVRLNDGSLYFNEENREYIGFGWKLADDPVLGRIVRHAGGMPGLSTWFERFIDAGSVLVLLNCRACADAGAFAAFRGSMEAIVRDGETVSL